MGSRRLTPADAVWLYSEWENNPQTVSGLMWLDREITATAMKDILQNRLVDPYPVFSQRIRKSRNPLLMPHWEDDPDFDINNHFEEIRLPAPGDKKQLEDLVSEQRSQQLDWNRPLWKFYLIQGYEGRSAVHGRIQHAIADGWSLVRLILSLADETDQAPKVVDKKPRAKKDPLAPVKEAAGSVGEGVSRAVDKVGRGAGKTVEAVKGAVADPKSVPAHLASGQEALEETLSVRFDPKRFVEFSSSAAEELAEQVDKLDIVVDTAADAGANVVEMAFPPRVGKTQYLHGKVGKDKIVRWIEPVPLAPVKQIGKNHGATINDVLMGVLTNALRGYLIEHHDLSVDELMTAVPISLRKPDAPLPRTLGNKFGLLNVMLPVGLEDPLDQIKAIHDQIEAIKKSTMPIVSFGVASASPLFTPPGERALHKFVQRHSIGVTTNVPGPRHEVRVAGAKVLGQWGMGGVSGNMATSFGIFTIDGMLNFALHADKTVVKDPDMILDLFLKTIEDLKQREGLTDEASSEVPAQAEAADSETAATADTE